MTVLKLKRKKISIRTTVKPPTTKASVFWLHPTSLSYSSSKWVVVFLRYFFYHVSAPLWCWRELMRRGRKEDSCSPPLLGSSTFSPFSFSSQVLTFFKTRQSWVNFVKFLVNYWNPCRNPQGKNVLRIRTPPGTQFVSMSGWSATKQPKFNFQENIVP